MTHPASTPPRIRVAIVGSGIIGHHHAQAVAHLPRLRVEAVIDAVPAAAKALAEKLANTTPPPAPHETLAARALADAVSAPGAYETLGEALADREIDLVVICTPSGLHAEAAVEALEAGKHVVVEKPLDVSLARAREVAELAERAAARGQMFSVISQHRFDPASQAVHRAAATGGLGRITSAVASVAWWREQSYYDSAAWRGTRDLDGGVTMNQAIHTIDLLVWLLGEPVEVFAYTGLLAHERIEVEDVAVACVRFRSGALAVLHASTAAYPGLAARLQIHGMLGSAVIHDDQLEFFHVAGPGAAANQAAEVVAAQEVRGSAKAADSFLQGHIRQYEDIVDAIDTGRQAGVSARESLASLAVVTAIYRSAELARPVRLEEL